MKYLRRIYCLYSYFSNVIINNVNTATLVCNRIA